MNLTHLSDEELDRSGQLAADNEKLSFISVLYHINEVNRRKSFSPRFEDLKQYAMVIYKYDDKSAWRRIESATLLKQFPHIEKFILSGALCMTTMAEIENVTRDMEYLEKRELLDSLIGKSSREIDRILRPKIAKLDSVKPLFDGRFEVKLTLTAEDLEHLKEYRNQIAHKMPTATMSEVVGDALQTAIDSTKERRSRRRKAGVDLSVQNEDARVPNAELRRTIYRNADGKCELCKSTYATEDDHIIAFARGGKTKLSNMRLVCRNCNQRQAFLEFGDYRKKWRPRP